MNINLEPLLVEATRAAITLHLSLLYIDVACKYASKRVQQRRLVLKHAVI